MRFLPLAVVLFSLLSRGLTPVCAQTPVPAAPAAAASAAAPSTAPTRPRIGLVLSGGGARGLSHVGVLKVLERELLKVNWDAVFASRVGRQQLSQRRKEEDFEISPVLEFGMRDGELRAPLGALSGRGLESLLRRYTLPARQVRDFDRLPIPFRAVATDMESGLPVVLREGDLALALRSSMSVPGVFAPTEVEGRILGDGGLVDNLPVAVARAMGADIIIAVNIGTPLSGRETLASLSGLTGQMINILTEQNVRQSLALLTPRDVLIAPPLGKLNAGDFNKARELMALGEQGALPSVLRLAALSVDAAAYAQWRGEHRVGSTDPTPLVFVRFEGSENTYPTRFESQLESKPGQLFDDAKAERDARRLAASGDYTRADFKLLLAPHGEGLVFDLEDKPWGPHYFTVGLDMSTDFRGDSRFNIKVSHNRHWLDQNGTEWRNRIQIGQVPLAFTEIYHPLNWTNGISNDWFVAAYAGAERRVLNVYNNDSGAEQGRFLQGTGRVGIDLGQLWGELGQFRLGITGVVVRSSPQILASTFNGLQQPLTVRETGLRLAAVVDQLDYANFPQHGYRVQAEAVIGRSRDSLQQTQTNVARIEAQATGVASWGPHTLNATLRAQRVGGNAAGGLGRYTLGGFHELSGYKLGQLDGNEVLFGRLTYYRRLKEVPLLTRGIFIGGTLEAGNAWAGNSAVSLGGLRSGMSLFFGADTGLGPVYLGATYAPRGSAGLYLFIGKP